MVNEIITLIANVALALSFIVALVFGIAQVRTAARDRRERLTLETLRTYQTREFVELMLFVSWNDLPKTADEIEALPAEERVKIVQFSQQMESLGILVAEGLVDIGLVDKMLGSFVINSWTKYKTLLTGRRKVDIFEGEYFEWMATQLEKRLRENPRKPFYTKPV